MSFGHEQLDVYRLSISYVGWMLSIAGHLSGNLRFARDQIIRASQSIPLNIAEGNGKPLAGDRRRFFEIARGSALECAAIQDVLVEARGLDLNVSNAKKKDLDRILAMLTRMGGRSYQVDEKGSPYGSVSDFDSDADTDSDTESIRFELTKLEKESRHHG